MRNYCVCAWCIYNYVYLSVHCAQYTWFYIRMKNHLLCVFILRFTIDAHTCIPVYLHVHIIIQVDIVYTVLEGILYLSYEITIP